MSTIATISNQTHRRLLGGDLLNRKSFSVEEVAEVVQASVSSVFRWKKTLKENNDDISSLERKPASGRPSKLSDSQIAQLKEMINNGAKKYGYETDRWTSRIVTDLIEQQFGVKLTPRAVRYILRREGLSYQMPVVKDYRKNEKEAEQWREEEWLPLKKSLKDNLPIVFLDEAGFSLRANRSKTWGQKGNPQVLREIYARNCSTGIGFLTLSSKTNRIGFYFSDVDCPINTDLFKEYLKYLHNKYKRKIIVVMDNLPAHKKAAKYFLVHHPDWFIFEYLPAYSPELNPVEQCWNWIKNVELPNFVATSSKELSERLYKAAQKLNQFKRTLAAFFRHARLRL